MRTIENDCVGCPQGCIQCGRNFDYEIIECDSCGIELDADNVYQIGDKDYCEKCYVRKSMSDEDALDILSEISFEDYYEPDEVAAVEIAIDALTEKIRGSL